MNTISKEAKPVFAELISFFLFFMLALHFTISICYNFTVANARPVFLQKYMEPLFNQNFKIFAPDVPQEKYELFVRYKLTNGVWTSWIKPGVELRNAFQKNRFSSSRYDYLLYKNAVNELIHAREDAIYYAEKNNVSTKNFESFVNESIQNSQHFSFMEHYLMQNWQLKFPKQKFPDRIVCALSIERITKLSNYSASSIGKVPKYWYFPEMQPD